MRLRLTAATSATDSGINKKNLRIGDGNINDFKQRHGNKKIVIMKIAKSGSYLACYQIHQVLGYQGICWHVKAQ